MQYYEVDAHDMKFYQEFCMSIRKSRQCYSCTRNQGYLKEKKVLTATIDDLINDVGKCALDFMQKSVIIFHKFK